MKLQVALDTLDRDFALRIAEEVCDYVDIIEAGTPLIKSCGVEIIAELKEFEKEIFADTKTVDAVELEAEMVKKHGADYFSILGLAPDNTKQKALKISGIKKALDLIGMENKVEKAREYSEIFDIIVLHMGIDEGVFDPEEFSALGDIKGLAVAGGINENNIDKIISLLKPEIIIIGRYITKNNDPKNAAKKLRSVLECI